MDQKYRLKILRQSHKEPHFVHLPETQAQMDLAKLRYEERLTLIESQILDCCEELSQISEELRSTKVKNRSRCEQRMKELDLEVGRLWRHYVSLLA